MTVDHPLPAHSLLGASAAHRWLNCPGSFALSRQAPPSRASIYAATGTLAHSFIDSIIKQNIRTPERMRLDASVIGTAYQVEGHDIVIDEDFVDGVNVMLNYIASVSPAYDMMHTELTVHLDNYFSNKPPVRMFGRTDVVLLGGPALEIVDYKNGSGIIVDPHRNPQMLYYAAGVVAMVSRMKPAVGSAHDQADRGAAARALDRQGAQHPARLHRPDAVGGRGPGSRGCRLCGTGRGPCHGLMVSFLSCVFRVSGTDPRGKPHGADRVR